jgi:DNA-binding CsgD family transcriptional regulator
MMAKRGAVRRGSSTETAQVYRRTLTRLAVSDQSPKAVTAMLDILLRWCGAHLAVLMIVAVDGGLAVVQAIGRSARVVARAMSDCPLPSVVSIRSAHVAGHSVLTAPLLMPSGIGGLLAIGVRQPRSFGARERRQLRQFAPMISIALQLRSQRGGQPLAPPAGGQRRLNRREHDVVRLLLAGQSVKETAAALGISSRTAETYLERLKMRHRQPRLHALLAHLVRLGVA